MGHRFRRLAALLALSSLALFQVEALWASSMCAAEMEMPGASERAAGSGAMACPMVGSGESHEHDEGSRAPDCPLVPAGAASCVGGVALLSAADEPPVAPAEDELSLTSSEHAADLLLAVALLRPPRA